MKITTIGLSAPRVRNDKQPGQVDVRVGSRLCENALEPRVLRIVFSIAFFRQKLPVQLVSASTKSRRKSYTQVAR
jgi:hypothetical protein